jgi:hypothetical protein
VLSLILILFVVFLGLTMLLAAGKLFLQGYLNETPPEPLEVAWQAPAAGAAVSVVLLLWAFLAYRSPDRYAALTDYSAQDTSAPFRWLWSIRGGRLEPREGPGGKVWDVVGGEEIKYRLTRDSMGRPFYENFTYGRLPSRPDVIIVEEDGQKVRFLPERDARGKFKEAPGYTLRYYDDRGRFMEEGYLGQLSTVRPGRTFVYVLLNLVHGAVWFVCLWLVLRFSLGQSILIAIGCWMTMTLFVMPLVLRAAQEASEKRNREVSTVSRATVGSRRREASVTTPGPQHSRSDPVRLATLTLKHVLSANKRGESRVTLPPAVANEQGYLAATVGFAKFNWTRVSSPARTATRSVRVSVLPSRTTSACRV